MAFSDSINRAARVVNATLGSVCTYTPADGSGDILDIDIVVNRNKKVNDEFGMLAGYRCEASVLRSDVTKAKINDLFVDSDGTNWKVNMITQETTSKWYLDIIEMPS